MSKVRRDAIDTNKAASIASNGSERNEMSKATENQGAYFASMLTRASAAKSMLANLGCARDYFFVFRATCRIAHSVSESADPGGIHKPFGATRSMKHATPLARPNRFTLA